MVCVCDSESLAVRRGRTSLPRLPEGSGNILGPQQQGGKIEGEKDGLLQWKEQQLRRAGFGLRKSGTGRAKDG